MSCYHASSAGRSIRLISLSSFLSFATSRTSSKQISRLLQPHFFVTLAMRPLGAFLFGIAADRFGRRPTLMINILFYSFVELLSGFAPTLTVLIILRALYGIAMGGEWGIGASLTMESIPPKTRGSVSGILQAGNPTGYLLAAILYGSAFH